MQRIADLLATAGTSETVTRLQTLLDGLKGAGSVYTTIEPLSQDRNNILANVSKVNLEDGSVTTQQVEFIHQATTERAGAMRAQQVSDLNAARTNVATLQKQMTTVLDTLEQLQREGIGGGGTVVSTAANLGTISCEVVNGELILRGFSKYKAAGYVPYLFRMTRKRNHYQLRNRPEGKIGVKYCKPSKGWHVYGSCHAVSLKFDTVVFSTNRHKSLSKVAEDYSPLPTAIFSIHTDKSGKQWVPWGRSMVRLTDRNGAERMLRFRFGIGFGKKIMPNIVKITPSNLVSNMAEFTIVYDPATYDFYFSRCGQ